jgi:predicted nucleic acid-binding protein
MTTYEKTGTIAAGGAMAKSPGPRGYLDTNLIIGLAEGDLAPKEMSALEHLLQRHKSRGIRLCTSHVAIEELARRESGPERLQHVIYMLLEDVPAIDEQFQAAPMFGSMVLGVGAPIVIDEMLGKLNRILSEDDARHIFHAARNGIDYFVTCDSDTILKRARKVEPVAGIRLRSPSQLVADLASAES